jgi:hypothetical protein
MGCFARLSSLNAVIVIVFLGSSGVSSASAFSAGDDSAPEVSEKRSGSKAFRGVVNEGFRNGGAGVDDVEIKELFGCKESNPPELNVSLSKGICGYPEIYLDFVIELL